MRARFGDFTLDSDSRQLWDGNSERHLSPKAFQFLRLLVEHRPRALSKAELHERLWPSTFVSDATLTSLVAEVRSALGEKAGRERFVRTVHRFGYAFKGTTTDLTVRPASLDARPRAWVIWRWGHIGLTEGEHLLGRDVDVAVWLESPSVSRHHAVIRISEVEATVQDLGSKNGTYVGGKRVAGPTRLADGDEIRLGTLTVQFRKPQPGVSTVTR